MGCARSCQFSSLRWDSVVRVPRQDSSICGRGLMIVIFGRHVEREVNKRSCGRLKKGDEPIYVCQNRTGCSEWREAARCPVCLSLMREVVVEIVSSRMMIAKVGNNVAKASRSYTIIYKQRELFYSKLDSRCTEIRSRAYLLNLSRYRSWRPESILPVARFD